MTEGTKASKSLSVFSRRKRVYTVTILCVLALFFFASAVTRYDPSAGLAALPRAFLWIVSNLVPDEKALTRLPNILKKLTETALLSVAVTVTAAVFAFFFSLMGSKTTRPSEPAAKAVRITAAFFRNVPDVVWAILLMFSFGQNILTGFFALFFTTFGMLTRAFIETVDEVSADCVEALHATGATYMQTVFQGIVPSSVSEILTWVLFMIETNIRSSTLIGILTGTGIGYLFDLYYKRLDYASASLVVLSIVVLVIVLETITGKIRKVIL
ncbi:PhnE/PtxC family ABC transporter permease [Papillibacter cinnamivorans]|uniref:Phosphonate transport system permease protein n=1 Tax=Papillibacter cinnamivorans DSM 12816 TaxID=1122930 RepID=A0A1W2BB28_9FIRM|nr:ABC transporter permease subunit [Papillibacter cinnamivorans]SMC70106.1 phosphonate transport system permease protein [Papillibacter cinnamivorans DSM 12816]